MSRTIFVSGSVTYGMTKKQKQWFLRHRISVSGKYFGWLCPNTRKIRKMAKGKICSVHCLSIPTFVHAYWRPR